MHWFNYLKSLVVSFLLRSLSEQTKWKYLWLIPILCNYHLQQSIVFCKLGTGIWRHPFCLFYLADYTCILPHIYLNGKTVSFFHRGGSTALWWTCWSYASVQSWSGVPVVASATTGFITQCELIHIYSPNCSVVKSWNLSMHKISNSPFDFPANWLKQVNGIKGDEGKNVEIRGCVWNCRSSNSSSVLDFF